MSKWFNTYDEAYAFLCGAGYAWAQYGALGWQHKGGRTCGITHGTGASSNMVLVTVSHR